MDHKAAKFRFSDLLKPVDDGNQREKYKTVRYTHKFDIGEW